MVGPTVVNPPTAIKPEPPPPPPDESTSKTCNSNDLDENKTIAQQLEKNGTECYHYIIPIETNVEYNKRNRIDPTDDFFEANIPFARQNSENLFEDRPSQINALIRAGGLIWHPHVVTIDSAASLNLIDI